MTIINKRKFLFAVVFVVLITVPFIIDVKAYEQKEGKITANNVNVRKDAGTEYERLNSSGTNVQLGLGTKVKVIGEKKASDGVLWYEIKFEFNSKTLTGFIHSDYLEIENKNPEYVYDEKFEKYLKDQGFPEAYKVKLRKLHARYPKWVFVADKLTYKWGSVIENEGILGRSLVWKDSKSSWKSLEKGAYNWETGTWNTFDGTSWVCASKEILSYCMDPRNFLDDVQIFQFELLKYDETIHKEKNVEVLLKNTFMEGKTVDGKKTYARAFMEAGEKSGVSPYHLVSKVVQEVGINGTSGGVTGEYRPATGNVYKNLYNYYNIGAYTHDGRGAVENGLIYAGNKDAETLRPWNTRYKALVGGAIFIGKGYINIGQDTLYYEKFDLVGTPYTHQYMSNIMAPKQEAAKIAAAYSETIKENTPLVFKIPIFQEMPAKACVCPEGDGSPNNVLKSLSIDDVRLTPTFSMFTTEYDVIVEYWKSSVNIRAEKLDESAKLSGTGKHKLNVGVNKLVVRCTAKNGDIRKYYLTIVRKEKPKPEPTTGESVTKETMTTEQETTTKIKEDTKYSTKYIIMNKKYIIGIEEKTKVEDFKKNFTTKNCEVFVYKSDGKTLKDGIIGTNNVIKIIDRNKKILAEYKTLIYGDVDGNGEIDIIDMLYVKRHILDMAMLDGISYLAADVNRMQDIDIIDMLYMKRNILDIAYISQK